ncbi:MAG: hypothetical protein AAGB22_00935, partial [Bacteroidota bacterium]
MRPLFWPTFLLCLLTALPQAVSSQWDTLHVGGQMMAAGATEGWLPQYLAANRWGRLQDDE